MVLEDIKKRMIKKSIRMKSFQFHSSVGIINNIMRAIIFLVLLSVIFVIGKEGFGPTDQEWGFVTVREKAHIFWWLHYTTAHVKSIRDKPLILWLQGGPGASSTGYGNFVELGPLDTNLNPRNTSWVQYAHVLFVDNPVGTGFSYVEDESLLVTNNSQIATDFMVFLKEFFKQNSDFENVPFYIFTESYGGKMTVEITLKLLNEVKKGQLKCNLKGIALGDSWISPVDSVINYAPFLYNMGIIDKRGFQKIDKVAQMLPAVVDAGKYAEAFGLWRGVEYEIKVNTYGVDMYNVLNRKRSSALKAGVSDYPGQTGVDEDAEAKINVLMNSVVKEALSLSQTWGSQNEDVFDALTGSEGDFMAPVIDIVEELLNKTDIKIAVFTAGLDLIVDTPGTVDWVNKMNWNDKAAWVEASRVGFVEDGYYQGYVKKAKNFAFYWVDRSGHMVPADNPSGMYHILKDVTNNFEV